MTAIIQLPPVHQGYSTARYILRNHSFHDLDAIDCAFEVLAHSDDPADLALCRLVADAMWQVPYPGAKVVAITMVAMAATFFGLATLLARVAL
jgi:hypothetical protein